MKTILVGSGKGGVGKTTVAALIATHLTEHHNVGLLDGDLSCPSVNGMFDLHDYQYSFNSSGKLLPPKCEGVNADKTLRVFSLGADIPADQFVAWTGDQLREMLREQFVMLDWGDTEYLVVDMPPGTADSVQTTLDFVSNAKVVPVTQNTPMAVADTLKFISMVRHKNMELTPLILNQNDMFAHYTDEELYNMMKLEILTKIPFRKDYYLPDAGLRMLDSPDTELGLVVRRLV